MTEPDSVRFESAPSVTPIYLVCDESLSMTRGSIETLNYRISEWFDEFTADPILDERVRVGIVAFSDTARVVLPLTEVSDVAQIPPLSVRGTTSYAAVFRFLRTLLETDISKLRQDFQVLRPIIIVITDGQPNYENWRDEVQKLFYSASAFRPRIFGFDVDQGGAFVPFLRMFGGLDNGD